MTGPAPEPEPEARPDETPGAPPEAAPHAAADATAAEAPEPPPEEAEEEREEEPARPEPGRLLRGTPVAPGLVLGRVHCKDVDLTRAVGQRVPLDQVEQELNRFHRALVEARRQLADLKARLAGRVPVDDARILDVHVAYLKDSVFISDVENLILNEQMGLEASIAKVITDFDRIFRLVENETLRERAVDLRDVGIRVLRHLEVQSSEDVPETEPPPSDYVLVARELSIVDMFNLSNEHVLGILTEEGGLTSHAAILARSMRIPTITGIAELLDSTAEGDFAIVDATEGVVRLNPDEVLIAQYSGQGDERPAATADPALASFDAADVRTRDAERVHVTAACGNLPEVEQAIAQGLPGVGLYRTELMYLIDRDPPSLESLLHHYAAVLDQARGAQVTFRLLHVDSSLEVSYLHRERELNPGLGRAGVRALLGREEILRGQLQALMLASVDAPLRIAIPFATDCGEVRRVKEILFEERVELRKTGQTFQKEIAIGAVLETPAAVLGVRDLARETDFLLLGLDSLLQYLLAADRENLDLGHAFETVHPFALRALRKVCEVCRDQHRQLAVFGATAVRPRNLPLLLGVGLREFCVTPVHLGDFLAEVSRVDSTEAQRTATAAAHAACPSETLSFVDAYRKGYADA